MASERSGRRWAKERIKRGKAAKAEAAAAPASPPAPPEQWEIEFLTVAGTEFRQWPVNLKASLGRIFDRIREFGLPSLTQEHAKQLRGKIWELRASADRQEGRALYVSVEGKRLVVLVCEIKKSQETPPRWIDLAEERAKTIGPKPKPKVKPETKPETKTEEGR